MLTVHADKDCEKCHGEGYYYQWVAEENQFAMYRCSCWERLYPQFVHRIKDGEEYEIVPAKKC